MLIVSYSYQLEISKRAEENKSSLYTLDGSETLGSRLRVQPRSEQAPQLSKCSIQWYRVSTECSRNEIIAGIILINILTHFQQFLQKECFNSVAFNWRALIP